MKASDKDSDRRKQKDLFDIFSDKKVASLSSEIQNMFKSLRLIEMLEEFRRNEFRADNWFAYNVIIKASPIEESTTQKFESYNLKTTKESKEDRPSFDIITDDNEVAITIDMPDTKKENIDLRITRDTIEIMPNNLKGKYHRLVNLPCDVKSKTATFTYKNGILDIVIKKENQEN